MPLKNVLLNNRVDKEEGLVIIFISLSLGSVVVFVTRVKRQWLIIGIGITLSGGFTLTSYFSNFE